MRLPIAVVIVAALSPLAVRASAPEAVSGSFQVVGAIPTGIRAVGGNCLIELDATFDLQGDVSGSFVANFRIVHLAPCTEPADEVFHAVGTFTGGVNGVTGSFEFTFQGKIDAAGQAQGDLVIGPGSGDLAAVHGMLTLTGQAGVGGTYKGSVALDP